MKSNAIDSQNPIIQFVSTSSNSVFNFNSLIPNDDTIPQNTEGDQVFTLSITPKYATSKLLIELTFTVGLSTNSAIVTLFQDSTADALAAISLRVGSLTQPCVLRYIMTSGTTSSTTFSVRMGVVSAGNQGYVNANSAGSRLMGGTTIAFLSIKEYLA